MTASAKKTILSGATPSAQLTLGNYLGALKQWVTLQRQYDCLFMVANMHAITAPADARYVKLALKRYGLWDVEVAK